MNIAAIYANLNCSDLQRSQRWFEALFQRQADNRPMPGLVEWHHKGRCGFQLFENADDAGNGTVTLIVRDIRSEHQRLCTISPGQLEMGQNSMVLRLRDPDGNLVVLAEAANEG
jgi:catechol 2,3-dioxygenase-like lactoylglutathione lyase family enzyme